MDDITGKWGQRVAERGFAQLPNYLVQLNQFLGDDHLSAVELMVLIQLAATWWKKDELPFPSVATLARRCGVSQRQVQRALARLEEVQLLTRVRRRTRGSMASNAYDLQPLADYLDTLSKAFPNLYPRRLAPAPTVEDEHLAKRLKLVPRKSAVEGTSVKAAPSRPALRLKGPS